MTQKDVIDRVRIIIGDEDKSIVPDDARIRALANFAYQKMYKRLGVSFKDVICDVVTGENPELLLPLEFYKAKLVLVNGIEVAETSYERAVAGAAYGLNLNNEYNGVIQELQLPQVMYYFRNTPQGRFLGVSPSGYTYEVFCVFNSVPVVQDSASAYTELIPPHYADLLVYATVLETLPETETFAAAVERANRQKEFQAEMLRLMPNTQATMQILLPIQVQTELKRQSERLRIIYEDKYEKELMRVKNTLLPSVKLPPHRYRQGLLDVRGTRSSNYKY